MCSGIFGTFGFRVFLLKRGHFYFETAIFSFKTTGEYGCSKRSSVKKVISSLKLQNGLSWRTRMSSVSLKCHFAFSVKQKFSCVNCWHSAVTKMASIDNRKNQRYTIKTNVEYCLSKWHFEFKFNKLALFWFAKIKLSNERSPLVKEWWVSYC